MHALVRVYRFRLYSIALYCTVKYQLISLSGVHITVIKPTEPQAISARYCDSIFFLFSVVASGHIWMCIARITSGITVLESHSSILVNLPQRPSRRRSLKRVQVTRSLPFDSSSDCLRSGRSSVHREYDIRHVLELQDTERIRAFTNRT